ncbi:hypothetical protein [Pseudoduganella umbonata]|uniref:Uncharacterized protein n=1 Tax=Pseudoduganella umbonata TaxID=864828 RepID=A0A4P8HTA3_9BURK|nr:hypothetical protein [Pseudoduganella umbonata]MBB3223059.1 hypothetical protein [Pseudoduganella umbonata]QCP13159.1 hypothetical protein FCL38_23985 [Pseudoduganella umbonata]
MSIIAARNFRQHINRMSTLQAEVVPYFSGGVIDYAGLAELGSRSGFDFTADEARQVLFISDDELTDFEKEMVSGGSVQLRDFKGGNARGRTG